MLFALYEDMKGLVINHNDIDDTHTCSYAVTSSEAGRVNDFGIVSVSEDETCSKDPGGEVVRTALQTIVESDESRFNIYNHSDYYPQLEMSRLPYDVREYAYDEKDYRIQDDASGTFSHTGGFLADAAVDFISSNYSRFESLVSTSKPPRPLTTSPKSEHKYNVDESATYYLYTDASYHPDSNETGISVVIIGENGGVYGIGKRVESQIIVRAELLAFINGVRMIDQIQSSCKIIAHTDCKDVVRCVNGNLKIDRVLQNKMKETLGDENIDVDLSCIGREANEFADSLAKVGRSRDEIIVGSRV